MATKVILHYVSYSELIKDFLLHGMKKGTAIIKLVDGIEI